MDVRYGTGAFIPNQEEAKELGEELKSVLEKKGMTCYLNYTNTAKPNGACIGNFWEVYEAIQILKGNFENDLMNSQASGRQIDLVVEMFMSIAKEIKENRFYGGILKFNLENQINKGDVLCRVFHYDKEINVEQIRRYFTIE